MFRAYLGLTMTGELGPELDLTAGSVAVSLNEHDEIQVSCHKESVVGVERRWFSPWSGCIVVTWEDEFGPERIISAGPIIEPCVESVGREGDAILTFLAHGVSKILEYRFLTPVEPVAGREEAFKAAVFEWSGVDLGSIVGRIVRDAMDRPNGALPIVVQAERRARRQRTYEGWNVANNECWKRISEITEVINGPDVMFRPRWKAGSGMSRFEWVLITGSEDDPGLPQSRAVFWDTVSQFSGATGLGVSSEAGFVHRVYGTGAGEESGVLLRFAERVPSHPNMPLLEGVVSDPDTDNADLVQLKANSALRFESLDQVSLEVFSEESSPFGSWSVGDKATVRVEGRLWLPDGDHEMRIIKAKWDLDEGTCEVECQSDVYGEEMAWLNVEI